MAEKKPDTEAKAPEVKAAVAKMIIANGKTTYRCITKCYHHDVLYFVDDRVCPPDGGDLPAEYFVTD